MKNPLIVIIAALMALTAAAAPHKPKVEKVDLDLIKTATLDENSQYYYPKLLKMFLSNDTLMTPEDYRYFYYGSLFQEDFDPYRETVDPEAYERIKPLYFQKTHTRAEKDAMQDYAIKAINNNPLDLEQLKNLVYVYEQKQKVNLAKIWKHKLNHLLATIASSGTGADTDNAWMIVLLRHEYDFLNLSGIKALGSDFVPPFYEYMNVQRKSDKDPEGYYFNIQALLDQYYLKHPSER